MLALGIYAFLHSGSDCAAYAFTFYLIVCSSKTKNDRVILIQSIQSVSSHNSASSGATKLKFRMKDACSRISGAFFIFSKFYCFVPKMTRNGEFSTKFRITHVSGHNSASASARKLKFGMKDACSRISGPFFHFFN